MIFSVSDKNCSNDTTGISIETCKDVIHWSVQSMHMYTTSHQCTFI